IMRMLSLRRPTTKMAPNATMTPNMNRPSIGWPPIHAAAHMTRPRNALNAGSVQSRVDRRRVGCCLFDAICMEHLLDRPAEVARQRDRQRKRGRVAVGL